MRRALLKLDAAACPAGKLPVVIDSGFGGVIFHEACGHSLETTAVAKKASVFADKLGQQIASTCVSAVDDGTMPGEWGSLNFDDEGMPTQRTQLIKDGNLAKLHGRSGGFNSNWLCADGFGAAAVLPLRSGFTHAQHFY